MSYYYKCKNCRGKFEWDDCKDYVYCPFCDQLYHVDFIGEYDAYTYKLRMIKNKSI